MIRENFLNLTLSLSLSIFLHFKLLHLNIEQIGCDFEIISLKFKQNSEQPN